MIYAARAVLMHAVHQAQLNWTHLLGMCSFFPQKQGGSVTRPSRDFSHLTNLYQGDFPKVLIQLPMFNEDAHCDLIIQRCCKVQWPNHRILIQVCDDSTRESVRKKVDAAVISALEQGHNVQLVRRDNRQGYKAGAMVDGMQRVEDQGFEYVAIFDADFEPPEDFLYQTVIHMVRDDNLAFVQTRWTFTNSNSLLTWAQKVREEGSHDMQGVAREGDCSAVHVFPEISVQGTCTSLVWLFSCRDKG
jgi:hypothetical protein